MNLMKTNIQTTLLTGALLGGILLAPLAAQAQNNVTPAAGGRLAVVDIKDASLKDALDLVFDSAGIKSRSIDASASQIYVPDVVRSNIAWDDLVRSLCLTYNYKFSRNRDGLYIIEPRIPIGLNPDGSNGFPGQEGFPGQGGFQGQGGFPNQGGFSGRGVTSAPANPFGFGGAPQGNTRNFSNRQMLPEVQTLANSQTNPRAGGRNGGRANNNGTTPTEPIKYTIIKVKHVYSGGIAALFADSSTITTDIFVTPGQVNSGGNNNNGGGNNNNGGGNSFGGGGGGNSFGGGGGSSFGGGGGSSFGGGGGGGFGGGGGGFGGGGGGFGGGGF